jgi:hypothetical protein
MANPRKPKALKVLQGTVRKDRDGNQPEYLATSGAGTPWPLASAEAVEYWDRVLPQLEGQRVITRPDLDAFATLANYHGAMRQKWASGEVPTPPEITQLRMMYDRFGLTPAGRGGVSAAGEPPEANPFGNLGVVD